MTFTGLDPAALALLGELPTWSPEHYADRSAELKTGITEPGWELIQDVVAALPVDLTVLRRSSVSPLHTDLRFAKNGAPRYKDHLLLTTWHGDDKRSGATMWLRIDATRAGLASGRERWLDGVRSRRFPCPRLFSLFRQSRLARRRHRDGHGHLDDLAVVGPCRHGQLAHHL